MVVDDQMGRKVSIPERLTRIISLVPSQTELLFDLGLRQQIAGRTKFCIHPADVVHNVPVIGGTKKFNFEKINAIDPDLIIGNKEENYQEGIEQLSQKYPVWMSDISYLADALKMIESVGRITNSEVHARRMVRQVQQEFDQIDPSIIGKALYLIWNKPMMAAGSGTFINEMMLRAGLENVVSVGRYPEITTRDFEDADIILLSSEPFPFKESHVKELQHSYPGKEVMIVDGEMFSWYGSRLLKVPEYFRNLRVELSSVL